MGENIQYKNYLVIFIDMLGTQAKVDINNIYKDYCIFHDLILEKDGKWITDGRGGGIASGEKIIIHSHTFSDCAYLLYGYNKCLDDTGMLIENALCHFESKILKLLDEGIVFRGGISYGEAFYDKKKNILFGPAINDAFKLESKISKTPRIVVSDEVADVYNKYFESCVKNFDNDDSDDNKLMKRIAELEGWGNPKEEQGRIVIKDSYDDKYIFNYLNMVKKVYHIALPELNESTANFKEALLGRMEEKLQEAIDNDNCSAKEKYEWMIEYINS